MVSDQIFGSTAWLLPHSLVFQLICSTPRRYCLVPWLSLSAWSHLIAQQILFSLAPQCSVRALDHLLVFTGFYLARIVWLRCSFSRLPGCFSMLETSRFAASIMGRGCLLGWVPQSQSLREQKEAQSWIPNLGLSFSLSPFGVSSFKVKGLEKFW